MQIREQEPRGELCLYELGSAGKPSPRFTLLIEYPSRFACRFQVDDERAVSVQLPPDGVRALVSTAAVLTAELSLEPNSTAVAVSLDGNEVARSSVEAGIRDRLVTRQTLGATLEGTRNCAAALGELVLIERGLNGTERRLLADYLRMPLRAGPPPLNYGRDV